MRPKTLRPHLWRVGPGVVTPSRTVAAVTDRVRVFIDGQNLFKGLNRRFKGRVHPLLLARELAGERQLAGTHYYSGIHDEQENESMFHLVNRRHDLIRQTGVEVTERTLRYHWEWRVDDRDLPKPWYDDAPDRQKTMVKRWRGAREKGIDVALALDAVASALTDECDVVIIVSRDRDLMEIANEIRERCSKRGDCVRVEVAYVSERRGDEGQLPDYDAHHEIDEAIVNAARDHFDYRNPLDKADVETFLATL